jgi:hypothetical protein
MNYGTPRELKPIADLTLAFVANAKNRRARGLCVHATDDEIRRIELCALATREAAMFFDLYGGTLDATPPQVCD